MGLIVRHSLTSAEAAAALQALSEWTPADAPGGGVHPGDLGWRMRLEDARILLWTDDGRPVATGFFGEDTLRVTVAPGADAGAVAADAADLFEGAGARSDGLALPGWEPDPGEPWTALSWSPQAVETRAEIVDESSAADRVRVQRAAFANSTFSVERWHTMKRSPAGELAVEALVRTPEGEPAAAATGWFAGVGRCGLLEPVGADPDHRGHGYGRDAVRGVCAALAERGASAVAVVTPSDNVAGVALYRSAGFTVVRENLDWVPSLVPASR